MVGVSKAAGGNSGVTRGIPLEYQGRLQTLVEQQMLTVGKLTANSRVSEALTCRLMTWRASSNVSGQSRRTTWQELWIRSGACCLLPLLLYML